MGPLDLSTLTNTYAQKQFYMCDTVSITLHGTESARSNSLDEGALFPPGQLAPRSHSVEVAVGRDLLDLGKLPLAVAERADRARLEPA